MSLLSSILSLRGVVSWSLFVDACRLLSICAFLLCSISLTWYSFVSLICALGQSCNRNCYVRQSDVSLFTFFPVASLYLLDRNKYNVKAVKSSDKAWEIRNPYKGYVAMRAWSERNERMCEVHERTYSCWFADSSTVHFVYGNILSSMSSQHYAYSCILLGCTDTVVFTWFQSCNSDCNTTYRT